MNHMALIIKVDRSKRLARHILIYIEKVAMIAVEACGTLACFDVGGVPREDVICKLPPERVCARDMAARGSFRRGRTEPGSLQKRDGLPWICSRRWSTLRGKWKHEKRQKKSTQCLHLSCPFICDVKSRRRPSICSGVSTSLTLQSAQTCPKGSRTQPYRSPQNMSFGGKAGLAP